VSETIDVAERFSVFVAGHPAPQGSKRHVGNGVMIESSKQVKPWRSDVRSACLDLDGRPVVHFDGAVCVRLDFVLKRPASTPKKRTPMASKRPDIDKLARAILDAIGSAGLWRDDSQVVKLSAVKRLAEIDEAPGCHIRIERAGE
jgi:crossover junction endodeoxyribonuclease RusA